MDTVGSSFDTLLAVYVGTTLSDLVPVAFDDEGGTNGLSLLTFPAVRETTYHIAVDGWKGAIGDLVLNIGPGVATAPYFTFPLPPSEMRFEGGRLDLQVYPGGTAPLSYQWFKDSAPLPGATNSLLALPNLRIHQTGS